MRLRSLEEVWIWILEEMLALGTERSLFALATDSDHHSASQQSSDHLVLQLNEIGSQKSVGAVSKLLVNLLAGQVD